MDDDDISIYTLEELERLEFCDEISRESTTGGGYPMDQAHDGGIGMHSGDVAFLH
jgi:hypothetical protein